MKPTIISIIVSVVLIGGALYLKNAPTREPAASMDNVSIVGGKQIIVIGAKGGYQPRRTIAKAGLPTILRVTTNGTFDCSSVIRIPSMDVTKTLPASGQTDIDLGSAKAGKLQGSCGMGMYPFEIDFKG